MLVSTVQHSSFEFKSAHLLLREISHDLGSFNHSFPCAYPPPPAAKHTHTVPDEGPLRAPTQRLQLQTPLWRPQHCTVITYLLLCSCPGLESSRPETDFTWILQNLAQSSESAGWRERDGLFWNLTLGQALPVQVR